MSRAAAWAALRRKAAVSTLPSIPNHKSSFDHVLKLHPFLSIHRRSSQAPIPAATILSRGYARMMRRSPPVRSKEEEETESETEPDDVEEENEAPDISRDDGEDSEDWEGFVLDFGNKDKGGDEEDSP